MKQVLIGFSVITIIAVIIYFVLTKKKVKDDYVRDNEEDISPNELSFSEAEFKNIANQIEEALFDYWVVESQIMLNLKKLKNKSDWAKLVSIFGVRQIDGWNISTSLDKGNLSEWLNDRLDAGEIRQVSEILQKIGVTF